MKRLLLLLLFCSVVGSTVYGQIKIGDNPQNIDAASVLELESNSRVLVITRINTAQMNAIVPSAGAIVYNTDLQCIHYYDGAQWINVCEEVGGIPNLTTEPLVNTNSTLVITPNGENNHIEVAPNSIRTEQIVDGGINGDDIQDNSIGQSKIGNDAVGRNEIAENAVGLEALDTDQITLSNFNNTPGFITGAEIVSSTPGNAITDNGGAFYDDTPLQNNISTNTSNIAANAGNITTNANNIQTNINAITANAGNITTNTTNLNDHITNDGDLDDQNEFQDLENVLTRGNNANGTVISNLGEPLAPQDAATMNYVDSQLGTIATDDDITAVTFDGTDLTVEEGTTVFSATLTALEESADITANTTLINNHIIADLDTSITNEIELPTGGTNGQVLATDGVGNYVWSNASVDTDDQTVDELALSPVSILSLSLVDDGALPYTVDLSSLEESTDITANTTLINNHITADLDIDDTNEIELPAGGTNGQVLATDGTGNYSWENAGVDTDNQTVDEFALSPASVLSLSLVNDGALPYTLDLSSLEESTDIAANTTLINNHITADLDIDDTNEIELPAGGTNGQVLATDGTGNYSWIVNGSGFDTDDQTVDEFALSPASVLSLSLVDDGALPYTLDLSSLEESTDIAANTTLINNHITADLDIDDTNEIELPAGGTNGQVLATDGTGNYSWIVNGSGFDTDDQTVDEFALSPASVLSLSLVDDGALPYTLDLSSLEESTDIAANTTLINNHITADLDIDDTNEIELPDDSGATTGDVLSTDAAGNYSWITTALTDTDDQTVDELTLSPASVLSLSLIDDGAAPSTLDLSALEESTDIAANTTLINNHITADLDIDDTNEIELPDDSGATTGDVLATDAAGNYSWITPALTDTDDQTIDELALSPASVLSLSLIDDGAAPSTLNLSALEESTDIAANTTLINNHITADLDIDDTNEIELPDDSGATTGDVLATDAAGNYSWITPALTDTDDQTIDELALSPASVLSLSLIDDGAAPSTLDLSALEESTDIAANTTLINNHITADLDIDDTNEIELPDDSSATTGDVLATDAAGNYSWITPALTDTDDQTIDELALSPASVLSLSLIDDGAAPSTLDLSALEESTDIAANTTLINNHITADLDIDDTNEIELPDDSGATTGDVLATDAAGNYSWITPALTDTDDQTIDELALSPASVLSLSLIDDGAAPSTLDLSALEESTDIAANTTLINNHITADLDIDDTNEIELPDDSGATTGDVLATDAAGNYSWITPALTDTDDQTIDELALSPASVLSLSLIDDGAAPSTLDLSALEESTDIAANTTLINNHITADLDIDDTNEIELPDDSSATTGDVLATDAAGNYSWVTNSGGHTGTTGSIFFADNATGAPTENNGQLFWDATNDKLYLGNQIATAGDVKLNVNGTTRTQGLKNSAGSAGTPSYRFTDDLSTGMFLPTPGELGLAANNSEAIRIDASQNVGIGTTTPDESLHIGNNMRLDGTFEDKDGEAGTAGQILSTTGAGVDWVDLPPGATGNVRTVGTGKVRALEGTALLATGGFTSIKGVGTGQYTVNITPGLLTTSNFVVQLTVVGDNRIYVTSTNLNTSFSVEIRDSATDNLTDAIWFFTVSQ